MKTRTILFLFLLISGMVSAQVKRVAVLETVDKENKVSYANKLVLRTSLSKAIANTPGYEVYDRTDVDAIMSEHTFQRTGLVNSDQIKRLGEMTGAQYILVAEAVKINAKNLFVTAKLLDVETARTIVTEMLEINTDHMQQGCMILAKKMFSDKRELDFGITSVGPQLLINSKSNQRLLGLKKYSYGDSQMDEKAFQRFLYKNNSSAYVDYMKSRKLIPAGWWTFGAGAVMFGLGIGLEETGNVAPPWYYAGISFASIGGVAILSSIPILGVGYHKKIRAFSAINNSLDNSELAISLNLQASQNGIGLALNF